MYEILSIIADNYKMRTGLSSTEPYEYYKGAWQNYIRDIDPAYITPNKINENNKFKTENLYKNLKHLLGN